MDSSLGSLFNTAAHRATVSEGASLNSFLGSLGAGSAFFAIQFALFLILKNRFSRIYIPRTYLVGSSERTKPPPRGLFNWLIPVITTDSSEIIRKCGMDAYFFIRYLRMLLRIFIPIAVVVLPILLPLNFVDGRGTVRRGEQRSKQYNVTGLDRFSFGNVRPDQTHRYWAHLVLGILIVIYVCVVFYDELRGYVRTRQAYLTSPQHRLRASATTVLVAGIPRPWLSVQGLTTLYRVLPGGVRNVWLNRDYSSLHQKIKRRSKIARLLEMSETALIQKVKKARVRQLKREAKEKGMHYNQYEMKLEEWNDNVEAAKLAEREGISAGNPQQVKHTMAEFMRDGWVARAKTMKKTRFAMPRFSRRVPKPSAGEQTDIGGTAEVEASKSPTSEHDHDAAVPETEAEEVAYVHNDESRLSTTNDEDCLSETQAASNPARADAIDPTSSSLRPSADVARDSQEMDLDPATSTDGKENPLTMDGAADSASTQPETRAMTGLFSRLLAWFGRGKEPAEAADQRHPDAAMHEKQETSDGHELYFEEGSPVEDLGEPMWKQFISERQRDHIRLPAFGKSWMPPLPFIGKNVDAIYYARRTLSRLNREIEYDQQHPEKYPLMNSAFVQFKDQLAAHMACQIPSHHMPKHMAPRVVEISPDDVIWDNMAIRWWERYIRTGIVVTLIVGLLIAWCVPATFAGLLSQIKAITSIWPRLEFLNRMPKVVFALVTGLLPQALLFLIMILLPMILRSLVRVQGVYTGMQAEIMVSRYYFAFLFIQVFLIVSISSGITSALHDFFYAPSSVPAILASNLPRASNYFLSLLLLQALSVSAGTLLQIGNLYNWFVCAPLFDVTARQQWSRQTNLPIVQWGAFFPVYTNLAAIGLVYSVISPLVLFFNVITFGLLWIANRYTTLYVTKFRFDTGGLLFPLAINQLFTGLYVLELCMIGLFFLVRDQHNHLACKAQAIVMIFVTLLTVLFQYLLNDAFNPLIKYLPLTMEDEVAAREKYFNKVFFGGRVDVNGGKLQPMTREPDETDEAWIARREQELRQREALRERDREIEQEALEARLYPVYDPRRLLGFQRSQPMPGRTVRGEHATAQDHINQYHVDLEKQPYGAHSFSLFEGMPSQLEDLTEDQRDALVQRAFQHEALRSKRPVIWIPRDPLGVSDDEVYRTQRFSKHIWISNSYTAIDHKGRVMWRRSPPDFSELDLIEL
ncbi:MAG: hypothetical protein M1826_000483 [Phylliscum demangeonii]|nr:MAG: hypothetical protein M1826_000483 [Phylliscum demangeonii]